MKNLSNLSIRALVEERSDNQDIKIAYFINVTFRAYKFWILYAFTVFGIILVTIAELSEVFRDGYRYFTSATNLLDIGNLVCAGICLICTLTIQYKDSAIWFGSTSVLLSWIINAKAIGDMPIVGNWVYLFGNTVKKVATFLLVFLPLLFGFGLRFKFMFPTKVCIYYLFLPSDLGQTLDVITQFSTLWVLVRFLIKNQHTLRSLLNEPAGLTIVTIT